MTSCSACGNRGGVTFTCVECCLSWLAGMTRETMAANAHMIERLAGADQMNKVRTEWKARKMKNKEE